MPMPDRASRFEQVDLTSYSVKKMVGIPLLIVLIAVAVLTYTYLSIDTPVRLGMDFKGGTIVTILTDETKEELSAKFAAYPIVSVRDSGGANEKSIEFGTMSEPQKDALISMLKDAYGSYEMRDISPLFGQELQAQAVKAVIIAFILMAIVVFVVFRTVIPSFAVILSAFSDIIIAVACMDAIKMELSLGTVAALLMLIGYSVDSDILLTTNLLRKKGEPRDKLQGALKTGITMTSTTLVAVFAIFFVSSVLHRVSSQFAPIPILRDISLVLLFGLTADLMNTWLLNAGLLRWYVERKALKRYGKRGVERGGEKRKEHKRSKADI
ncbi:MAG: protein translocase subunit SecF [Methanophagales archaeon ANME-1-THS]|nr:MAG: protein translocase subunit SecF [Methanophagales archaeon ANME-1-THS]